MVPDATHQPSKATDEVAPKPRRWYRRRGWQVLLVLLAIFLGWFTWAIIELNERSAFEQSLKTVPNCDVSFSTPDWVNDLTRSDWCPKPITNFLSERLHYAVKVEFNNRNKKPTPEAVLASFGERSWPQLTQLSYQNETLWNGHRLSLPLQCPNLEWLLLKDTNVNDEAIEQLLKRSRKITSLSLANHVITGRGLAGIKHLEPVQ